MRRWGRERNLYKVLSILLLLTTLFLAAYIIWPAKVGQIMQGMALPDLSTSGFSKVESVETGIIGNVGSVNLRTECYDLAAVVEPEQAESIQRGVDKTYVQRPNAHDIAKEVFESLKIEVLMVKITQIRDNAFYAKLIVRQGNTVLNMDARPSDAIAIALRMNSTIYINQTLLKEMGRKTC